MRSVIRTMTATILAAAVLVGAGSAAAAPIRPVCGDVTNNATVTTSDALLLLKKAVGQPATLMCMICPSAGIDGNPVQFGDTSGNGANYLLGVLVKIPEASTVTRFGVIATSGGPHIVMGLYKDNGGEPDALIVATGIETLAAGSQEFTVPATPVASGYYWIAAVSDDTAPIGYDAVGPVAAFKYRTFTFSAALPNPFGPHLGYDGSGLNYWVKVLR